MGNNAEVYALCYCIKFDIKRLQASPLTDVSSITDHNVLCMTYEEGHIFIFDYGVLVFWKLNDERRNDFISKIKPYAIEPLGALIEDSLTFQVVNERSSIKNDHIYLDNDEMMTLLAVSHGIAQSAKLAQFEYNIQQTINDHSHIPRNIAENGKSRLSRAALAKLRGRLYLSKSDIMLNYDLLDTPDFFWDNPELDAYFSIIVDYLEVKQRVDVLGKKLETIHELFGMIADELRHKHSSLLEWIIIWLIAFEIIVFLVHDIFKWL